ncbi:release factor glutamine methyltransferase [Pseudarcicella hirudinis]|uniref:Release factor glutamine methyltransferase n=1 Tax=Pseudarcicella hirudinis TaxID=1079859 RepID=A0A1I5QRZ5_9BACT|nr:peptide chain release factor N(5)-glutamine methyltransferase [Pseudarcicella hirudinis]SFP48837.1 release factor glutamine methyltransferase [Pseudarcicella hirudinis]
MILYSSRDIFDRLVSEISTVYDDNEAKSISYWLLSHFQNLSKTDIFLDKKTDKLFDFEEIIIRLKKNEPVQYIIGETEFYGRNFKVTKATLIPRPETEELIQLVSDRYKNFTGESLKILDIGTGSGCIAVSLAKELPVPEVMAFDISEEALKVAEENARMNDAKVSFLKTDVLNIDVAQMSEKFDIIVSNPPYVTNREAEDMQKNVLDFEPHLALFVEDHDPLIFYRRIAELAGKCLNRNGFCAVEINQAFGKETAEVFKETGFSKVEVIKDLSGRDRFVSAGYI